VGEVGVEPPNHKIDRRRVTYCPFLNLTAAESKYTRTFGSESSPAPWFNADCRFGPMTSPVEFSLRVVVGPPIGLRAVLFNSYVGPTLIDTVVSVDIGRIQNHLLKFKHGHTISFLSFFTV
jgi:hypothetical protein